MQQPEPDSRELRRLIRDLVALATTPAAWVGRELPQIVDGVADILLYTLRAEAVHVAVLGRPLTEGLRAAKHPGFASEVQRLRTKAGSGTILVETVEAPDWPSSLRVAIYPIGLSADDGFVAVGCSNPRFPSEPESLLLSVAANQAAIAIQTVRLRAKAEFERRHVEELLAQAPAAIGMMVGPEHRWVYVNEKLVRVTGRSSAADFVGKTVLESLPEIESQPFVSLIDQVYCSGQPYVGREMKATLNRSHTGQPEEAYFDFVYQPIRNVEGAIDGVLVHSVEVTDKVLARKKIEESEERLRAIIETTPECVKLVAADGTLLHMNPAGLSMVGADSPEAVLAKNVYDLIAPEDRQRFRDFNESVCRGARGGLEFDIVGLKGVRRHMETHAAPFVAKDSSTVQLSVSRDITERKRAEDALRQSEGQFRALANAMPQLVWMANPNGWIFWYNQRWYQYTGTTPEQMEGWGWQSVHDPAVLPSVLERWKLSIATGQPFEMTFPLRGRDGTYRPFLTRVVPVRDRQGNITRWFGTNTDVSVEVGIQERLQAALTSSQRLAAIVESSEDAIVSKDLKGIVTSWNPAAERIFGYTAREMIGRSIRAIIPPELQHDEDRILATIGRGDRIEHFETVRLTRSGERIDVSLTISPVRDENGRIVGAAKIARNITERKKAEQALRTTERLASVGRLAATVAHEINNPLEAVTNLVYLAKDHAVRDDVREFLVNAEEELIRISHLTKQTLGFYRETKIASPVRVGALLTPLVAVFTPRSRNKGVEICPEILEDPEISAVPGEIRQLLANLLSNSIDAVKNSGRVRIRISGGTAYNGHQMCGVRITVADSGSGIPASIRERIFEPFFTTKKDVGTGLGLWVCKNIVEKHHGAIRVKSSTVPGKTWSVISVFLPSLAEQALQEVRTKAV